MRRKKHYQGLTADFLNEHFEYRDGRLFRRRTINGLYPAGTELGKPKKSGYIYASIMYRGVLLHRVIFLMHHGFVPDYVDHIDSNPSNNRIENLRAATSSQNIIHSKRKSRSGFRGVRQQTKGSWCATLCKDRSAVYRANFSSAEEAARAYDRAAIKHHKEFAILNFPRSDYE